LGKSIQIDRQHVMQVAAVIEDLPANTHLDAAVFVPAIASFSRVTLDEMGARPDKLRPENVYTYVRLRPHAQAASLDAAMRGFAERHVTGEFGGQRIAQAYTFNLVPLTQIHLQPRSVADMKPPGDPRTLQAMIGIAVLIAFVAGSNFVSMMTARAAQRAVEVGIRKAVGATRRQIIAQFLGECLFFAALALTLAIVGVEMALPALNGFLQRDMVFNYLGDPSLGAGILAVWVVVGLAAGAYPALVLSMFRPSAVLRGIVFLPGGSGRLRQTLVICQFATLIALIVSTITIHRQTLYAMEDRLRLPSEQIYVGSSGCPASFREEVEHIQGVLSASCASDTALAYGRFSVVFASPTGDSISLGGAPVDYGFLELFDVKPLAGRLFAQDQGEDNVLRANPASGSNPSVVINESAARALGYASPQAAVNQFRRWNRMVDATVLDSQGSRIIGVIPDFSIGSVRDVIEPTAYYIDPSRLGFLILKFAGPTIPESLRAVQAAWTQQAGPDPFEGMFLSQYVNDLYADIRRQSAIFSVFSCVAVVIASLGLLGLAVFTAARRTREIGLRKVMGANRWDILRFLAWQFARPVLWANLIAWPLAYVAMQRWLEGFAYHVDLNPLVFVASSVLALIIALVTVAGHALLVARVKPVAALRYE
jgi:putative ABC transport system permease protein